MNLPVLFENPVIKENGNKIIHEIENNMFKFGELDDQDYWKGRTLGFYDFNESIQSILLDHKNFMLSEFSKIMNFDEELYLDTLHVVRWTEGYQLTPHADKEEPDGSAHPFPWRDYGTVTFLNDDFEGGVLHYPNKGNLEVPAQPGFTAVHTGGIDCLHGVTKVTKGVRYTLASFLTFDKSHAYLNND